MSNREIYEADIHIFGTRSGSNNVVIKPASGKTLVIEGTVSGGGAGAPGGSDTDIQYNNAGVLAGDSSFWFDILTQTMTVKNMAVTGNMSYPKRPWGLVLGNTAQIINTDVWAALIGYWGTATVNGQVGSNPSWNPSAGIFTAQVEGLYSVSGSAVFSVNMDGYRHIAISIDNAVGGINLRGVAGATAVNSGYLHTQVRVYLTVGQTVTLMVYQTSGGTLAMSSTIYGEFSCVLV